MGSYGLIDKDGWMTGVVMQEVGFDPKDYPCDRQIELGNDQAQKLIHSHLIMFHDGEKLCQIKDPKIIWKRLRSVGIPSQLCRNEIKKHWEFLNQDYPEISGVNISDPSPVAKRFEPDFDTEFLPGLKICSCDENDIDLLESQMVNSGLYNTEEAWFLAAQWLDDPMNWAVKTVWKDRVLQIEIFHFNIDARTVGGGFTAHIDRTRPLWFWRQMSKPVLQCLYGHGFESIKSSVRKDKVKWTEFLKDAYGHELLRETADGLILRLQIKDAIQKIGDWPARRTMGADWKWEKDGVTVREAIEADFPNIQQAMDISWGKSERKALALTMLEDRWILDKAAILLASFNGEIIDGRTFRERQDPTISSFTSLFRWQESKTDYETALEGYKEWQKGVGYKESSFVIETSLHEKNKSYEDNITSKGWRIHSKGENLTEWRTTL
jgi:hypothetical protein